MPLRYGSRASGAQELRGDEAFGYFFTQQSYRAIVDQTLALDEPHPVASYFVLKAWQKLAGSSEFALRFAGAWFSVLAVALVVRLSRRLGLAQRTAIVATFLLALSPYAIWHAQDARMYSMSLALSVAVVWLAIEALARRRWQWVAAYIAVAWLALHTHYFAGFVLVALTLFVLGRALVVPSARRGVADWFFWNVILLFAYIPWLTSAESILAGYGGNGDSPSFAAMTARALAVFAVGESIPAEQRVLWAGALAIACALGALRLWMGGSGTRRALWLLACWGIIPVVLTWYGAIDRPIFNERYLVAAAPAWLLLAAATVQPLPRPRRWLNIAAALVLSVLVAGMAMSLARHYSDPAYSRTRGWRELSKQMLALGAGVPPQAVRYAQNYPDPTLWYYTGDVAHLVLPPAALDAAAAAREVRALQASNVERVVLAVQDAPTWDAGQIAQRALDADHDRVAAAPLPPWTVEVWAQTAQTLPPASEIFGDAMHLTGALVDPGALTAGGVLSAQLEWQAIPRPDHGALAELAATLQLLGPDGALVAQSDHPLEVGPEPVRAHYGILLPDALSEGTYRLILAVYAPGEAGAPRLLTAAGDDIVELARLDATAPVAP